MGKLAKVNAAGRFQSLRSQGKNRKKSGRGASLGRKRARARERNRERERVSRTFQFWI